MSSSFRWASTTTGSWRTAPCCSTLPEPNDGVAGAVATTLGFVARNLRLWASGRWYRFGYACVNFGTPISAREWFSARGKEPRRLAREERFALVGELGGEIMAAIGRVVPVLPVALVAGVLTDDPERRFDGLELKARVERRIRELEAAGARVYVPRRDRDYAIEVGVRMLQLRRLVVEEDGLYRAASGEIATLRYYANSIEHLIARDEPPRAVAS